jgi:hypothetical protein
VQCGSHEHVKVQSDQVLGRFKGIACTKQTNTLHAHLTLVARSLVSQILQLPVSQQPQVLRDGGLVTRKELEHAVRPHLCEHTGAYGLLGNKEGSNTPEVTAAIVRNCGL